MEIQPSRRSTFWRSLRESHQNREESVTRYPRQGGHQGRGVADLFRRSGSVDELLSAYVPVSSHPTTSSMDKLEATSHPRPLTTLLLIPAEDGDVSRSFSNTSGSDGFGSFSHRFASRKKWKEQRRDVKVDDVVLVMGQDSPRGEWPLARVVETYPGPDGHVRVAKVQLGQQTLLRPITKLCMLLQD